jgi:hypothetical protein
MSLKECQIKAKSTQVAGLHLRGFAAAWLIKIPSFFHRFPQPQIQLELSYYIEICPIRVIRAFMSHKRQQDVSSCGHS